MDELAVGFCVLNHVNGYLFDCLSRHEMGTLLALDPLTVLPLPKLNLSLLRFCDCELLSYFMLDSELSRVFSPCMG